jgi:hypothetical protein
MLAFLLSPACADPPGDANLVLTIIATNLEAKDVASLSATPSNSGPRHEALGTCDAVNGMCEFGPDI